jgi:predicted acyltransferase
MASDPPVTAGQRLVSLDALRGFDMFWIVGGGQIIHAICHKSPNPLLRTLAEQFTHVDWEGFRFYDLIFPLFLFMIGVAIPFSFAKRRARGDSKRQLMRHVVLRVAILIFLGMLVNGNLLSYNIHQFQITYSVLQMLALGYLVASSILLLDISLGWQIAVTTGLLLLYWALETFVPLPSSHVVGVYKDQANFGDWLNNFLLGDLQGRWRLGWILGIMPHAATCMLGTFAGQLLRSSRRPPVKLLALVGLGLFCLAAGWWWGQWFPVIKNRWTSTFALVAGGWSYLLLALFYLIVDVLGWRKWAFPFVVIGTNAIAAYMAYNLFGSAFRQVAEVFLHGLKPYVGGRYELLAAAGTFAVLWLILFWMYRKQTFIRI